MKYRAKANREVRELTPSEVTALVPWLYEPIEDEVASSGTLDAITTAVRDGNAPLGFKVEPLSKRRRRA